MGDCIGARGLMRDFAVLHSNHSDAGLKARH